MSSASDGATAESGGRGPEDGREWASPDESAGETTEGAVEPAQSCLCEDTMSQFDCPLMCIHVHYCGLKGLIPKQNLQFIHVPTCISD